MLEECERQLDELNCEESSTRRPSNRKESSAFSLTDEDSGSEEGSSSMKSIGTKIGEEAEESSSDSSDQRFLLRTEEQVEPEEEPVEFLQPQPMTLLSRLNSLVSASENTNKTMAQRLDAEFKKRTAEVEENIAPLSQLIEKVEFKACISKTFKTSKVRNFTLSHGGKLTAKYDSKTSGYDKEVYKGNVILENVKATTIMCKNKGLYIEFTDYNQPESDAREMTTCDIILKKNMTLKFNSQSKRDEVLQQIIKMHNAAKEYQVYGMSAETGDLTDSDNSQNAGSEHGFKGLTIEACDL